MTISRQTLRRVTLGMAAANLAAIVSTTGGWLHLWTFTDTWQFDVASWAVIVGGLISALSLHRRALANREERSPSA